MSKTTLCNLVLDRIGSNVTIENVESDQSAEARACRRWYDQCLDEVLGQFPWAFARRWVLLGAVADAEAPGWDVAYRYPAEAVTFLAITDESGLRVPGASIAVVNGQEMRSPFWVVPNRYEFEVMGDSTGRLIMADLEQAYGWYTARIVDDTQFDALFRRLLVAKLAIEISSPLKADAKLKREAETEWAMALSIAQARALNETGQAPRAPSPSVSCR